jgi:hypothetical protein
MDRAFACNLEQPRLLFVRQPRTSKRNRLFEQLESLGSIIYTTPTVLDGHLDMVQRPILLACEPADGHGGAFR